MGEVIEGWTCGPYPEGARGAVRQDGRGILLYANGGLSGSDCYVPPAVLAWLVRPMLAAAVSTTRIESAARAAAAFVLAQGQLGNHGHRRAGTACGECQVLNELLEALGMSTGNASEDPP